MVAVVAGGGLLWSGGPRRERVSPTCTPFQVLTKPLRGEAAAPTGAAALSGGWRKDALFNYASFWRAKPSELRHYLAHRCAGFAGGRLGLGRSAFLLLSSFSFCLTTGLCQTICVGFRAFVAAGGGGGPQKKKKKKKIFP